MAQRILDFTDGYSSATAPTQSLPTFASTTAFVTAKGSSAADGDMFYDTTDDVLKVYANGSWTFVSAQAAALTASRALVSSASGQVTVATTTSTEIGYVNGVTSAIQTQIDAKLAKAGTTAADSASSGIIGEFQSVASPTGGTATPGSSGTTVNVASMSLTAGDWEVWGSVGISTGGASVITAIVAAISTSSATNDDSASGATLNTKFTLVAGTSYTLPIGRRRINISSTTTVYLIGRMDYSALDSSTWNTASKMYARRMR